MLIMGLDKCMLLLRNVHPNVPHVMAIYQVNASLALILEDSQHTQPLTMEHVSVKINIMNNPIQIAVLIHAHPLPSNIMETMIQGLV